MQVSICLSINDIHLVVQHIALQDLSLTKFVFKDPLECECPREEDGVSSCFSTRANDFELIIIQVPELALLAQVRNHRSVNLYTS